MGAAVWGHHWFLYLSSLSLSWLCQDYQQQMQKLDGGIEEVNGWIDGAEKKMNEMDRQGPNDAVLKVLIFIFMHIVFTLPKLTVYHISMICFLS